MIQSEKAESGLDVDNIEEILCFSLGQGESRVAV
jgi:hypothetical protein